MPQTRPTLSRRSLLVSAAAFATAPGLVTAQTPVASPIPTGDFIDRITRLLAIAPAELAEVEDSLNPFTYIDLASQLAAVGIPKPVGESVPEGLVSATLALPLSHNAFRFALTTAWADTFGFWPLEIDQMLTAGGPPDTVSVFTGIDTERVRSALAASGYAVVLQEIGGEYLSFGDEISPATDVGRLGLGSMNQAVVRDGIAIFTRDEGMIQRVTQVMAGLGPSILEVGGWPDLMTTLAGDTVGVVTAGPAAFARSGDASAIVQASFSVRAGATEDVQPGGQTARIEVRIRYVDAATAADEAKAIPERWESMTSIISDNPFTDLMIVESAGVAEGDPTVATINFRMNGHVGQWYQMVVASDLGAFVPQA